LKILTNFFLIFILIDIWQANIYQQRLPAGRKLGIASHLLPNFKNQIGD